MAIRKAALSAAWAASALALVPASASADISQVTREVSISDATSIQDMTVSLDAFGRPSVAGADISQLVGGNYSLKKMADINEKNCTSNTNCRPS
jgi:hypothetical protein